MRHDFHFVDELTCRVGSPLGRMISISKIEPNPQQPRISPGDLTDLKASIEQKGILEPVLVRFYKDKYQIISGERRFSAAKEIGLEEVPCIIIQASDEESIEISLIENLQRKDLTPFEEADGLNMLCHRFNYTHDEIATKIGKSRSTITETLSLTKIPSHVRKLCKDYVINSKSMLLQIARQKNEDEMIRLLNTISKRGLNRDQIRYLRSSKNRKHKLQNYIFKFSPKDRSFSLKIKFKNPNISSYEIIKSLREVIAFIGNK